MNFFTIKDVRPLESYNLPEEYKREATNFLSAMNKEFGSSIRLLVLTGSGGKEKIIEEWSDLDFMIVFDETINSQNIINSLVGITSKSRIKIGITFYSCNEFEKGFIDTKTISSLELIRKGMYSAVIADDRLKIPLFSDQYRRNMHKLVLGDYVHSLRRKLYIPKKEDIPKISKEIYNIKKFIISMNGELLIDYDEISKKFRHLFSSCPENFSISQLKKGVNLEDYRKQCMEFLDFVVKKALNEDPRHSKLWGKFQTGI